MLYKHFTLLSHHHLIIPPRLAEHVNGADLLIPKDYHDTILLAIYM